MQRTVEILLAIGILVNLIKGADLILRPHQQKWLQDKFETLTLRLSDTKPLTWFGHITNPVFFWVLALITGFPLAYALGQPLLFANSLRDLSFYTGLILLSLSSINKANTYAKGFISYIGGTRDKKKGTSYSFWTFIKRFLRVSLSLIILCSLIGFAMYILSSLWLHFSPHSKPVPKLELLRISFIPAWPFIFHFLNILTVCSLIILAAGLLLVTEILLIFIRAVCWRIAEYNKGAFSAIILIVTVSLGVAEFYLKYQPPSPAPASASQTPGPTPHPSQSSTTP